jgi:hypothetical protein
MNFSFSSSSIILRKKTPRKSGALAVAESISPDWNVAEWIDLFLQSTGFQQQWDKQDECVNV